MLSYCLKCKKKQKTDSKNSEVAKTDKGKLLIS